LELYHHNISVCAQKVRLVLSEKRLPWTGHHVDLMKGEHLRPEFLRINPRGLVPVLVDEGQPIIESTIIMEYLEDRFPERPLRPAAPAARAAMRLWTKVPDDGLHVACASITHSTAFLSQLRANHDREAFEKRLAKLPDQARAARQRQIFEHGVNAPIVRDAVLLHDTVLGDMESALGGQPWLGGADYSLADIALLPYVTRLDRLGLDGMWAGRPRVADWFRRAQARPSFAEAVTAFRTDAYDDELKKRGIDVWPQIRALL
jgi:glutathione S-transferase